MEPLFPPRRVTIVTLIDPISGSAPGPNLNKANQVRGVLETGVLF